LAVNQETANSLKSNEGLTDNQIGLAYGAGSSNFIVVEGGLNTNLITKSPANRQTYIQNMRMHNMNYNVGIDRRLHGGVYTTSGGKFKNAISNNLDKRSGFVLQPRGVISSGARTIGVQGYDIFRAKGIPNQVFRPQSGGSASDYSELEGPGDTVMAFMFNVKPNLQTETTGVRDVLYSMIGSVNANSDTIFPLAGRKYDYIDTMTYVYGKNTGALISIPVRIIRYAGI